MILAEGTHQKVGLTSPSGKSHKSTFLPAESGNAVSAVFVLEPPLKNMPLVSPIVNFRNPEKPYKLHNP